jgi:hypothetical protein
MMRQRPGPEPHDLLERPRHGQYDAGRAILTGVEVDCRPRWKRGTQAKRPRSMPRLGWSRSWPRSRPASSWISCRNGGPRCPSWILREKKWGWLDPYSLTALAQLSGYSRVTAVGILQETKAETPRPRGISKPLIGWRLAVPLQPPCMLESTHNLPLRPPLLPMGTWPLTSKDATARDAQAWS